MIVVFHRWNDKGQQQIKNAVVLSPLEMRRASGLLLAFGPFIIQPSEVWLAPPLQTTTEWF
jgi:hypothetical protein